MYTMYTMYTKFQALINKDEAKKCFDIFQRQTAELQSGPTLEGLSKFQNPPDIQTDAYSICIFPMVRCHQVASLSSFRR